MYIYEIGSDLIPVENGVYPSNDAVIILTSEELNKGDSDPKLKTILSHTPSPREAHVCKAEAYQDRLSGFIVTPEHTHDDIPVSCAYLLMNGKLVICDDTGAVHSMVQHMRKNGRQMIGSIGGFFYEFMELLLAKDLHHLQKIEDKLAQLEDRILAGGNLKTSTRVLRLFGKRWPGGTGIMPSLTTCFAVFRRTKTGTSRKMSCGSSA